MSSTRMLRMVNLLTRNGITGAQFQTFASQPGVQGEMELLRTHTSIHNRLYSSDAIPVILSTSAILRTYLLSDATSISKTIDTYARFLSLVSTTEGEDFVFGNYAMFDHLCKNPTWVAAYFATNLAARVKLHGSNLALSALLNNPASIAALRTLSGYTIRTFTTSTATTTQTYGLSTNSRGGIVLGMNISSTFSSGNLEVQSGTYRADYTGTTSWPGTDFPLSTSGEYSNTILPLTSGGTSFQFRQTVGGSRTWYMGILSTVSTSAS